MFFRGADMRFTYFCLSTILSVRQYREAAKKGKQIYFHFLFLFVCLFVSVISISCPPVSKFRDETADDTQDKSCSIPARAQLKCLHMTTAVARHWGYVSSNIPLWVEELISAAISVSEQTRTSSLHAVFFQLTGIRFTGIFQLVFLVNSLPFKCFMEVAEASTDLIISHKLLEETR